MATKELLQKAILELLIGKASGVSDTDGTTVATNKNTDKIASQYNDEFSIQKHFTSKERLDSYPLKGMQQTAEPKVDPQTTLPYFDIVTANQENYPIQGEKEEGGIDNIPLDQIDAKVVVPHDYFHNPMLQSLLNTIAVTIANSISEATMAIITAKIENNFTDFTIKFDPVSPWNFKIIGATGTVVPGGQGQLINVEGTAQFSGEYSHKAKLKVSDLGE